ncbi:creatininase family protein [Acidobacteriota bacterium]
MNKGIKGLIAAIFILVILGTVGLSQELNPLFTEKKIKNYLPHMTWHEVEMALQKTDMVIIPVGSIEQHGKHLPLCTDIQGVIEECKLIAQKTEVLVAPIMWVGISEHHMGFPGTMTISPETFEAVVFEGALSLIRHGFKKIMIYNGHGGNNTAVNNVLHRINHKTEATAVSLNAVEPPREASDVLPEIDWHAGVGETSWMLYVANSLVDMSKAEKPVLTFPPSVQKLMAKAREDASLGAIAMASLFTPKKIGKKGSTRELTNNGVVSSGDPKNARVELGRKGVQSTVDAAVKFIEEWKKIDP